MNRPCLTMLALLAGLTTMTAHSQESDTTRPAAQVQDLAQPVEPETVPAPVPVPAPIVTDTRTGTGAEAVEGATLTVHYTGYLLKPGTVDTRGKKFDSSYDRAQPITFILGAHRVIPGWEAGLTGMKVGGRRRLVIPPELAYGARGAGAVVPPNATLIFDVDLLAVKTP